MLTHRSIATPADWRAILHALPRTHLLQSWDWGDFKSRHGWTAERRVWELRGKPVAAAQLLTRTAARAGLTARLIYVPRGPLLDWADAAQRARVLDDLRTLAHRAAALFLKIDPEVPVGYGIPGEPEARPDPHGADVQRWLRCHRWRPSNAQVQFRNTLLLDITPSEEALLASFKQKTRYNIRLAGRRNVTVRAGTAADADRLYAMFAQTSLRDGFAIHAREYYLDLWNSFIAAGRAQPLLAEVDGEVVGGAVIFFHRERATYMHGMSTGQQREKMPNYLLQWEAIRTARARGCTEYDLWGAPDSFDESDSMWGVWRFKSGFRGTVVRTLGAWDYPVQRARYWTYNIVMPRLLARMRRRDRRRTPETVSSHNSDIRGLHRLR